MAPNLSRAHMSRREHVQLLSKPNWRWIAAPKSPIDLGKVAETAIRGRVPKRVLLLAGYIPKKHKYALLSKKPVEGVSEFGVSKSALNAVPSQRIQELSTARFPPQPKPLPQSKVIKTEEEWERHMNWAKKRSEPKRVPPPPELPLQKTKTIDQLDEYMTELATPLPRRLRREVDPARYFRVRKHALEYEATDRLKELSQARPLHLPEAPPKTDKRGPTPRTDVLAKHIQREKEGREDAMKEDAFSVSPLALKHKPSARTKELATPLKRRQNKKIIL
uniref:Testicular haploid expressed protein n=1 Tax=Timema bartmani TaxID=61472 RepID=A0A7R9ELV6_9NEOP|nr:unnamed protein product [Timema bartmani]